MSFLENSNFIINETITIMSCAFMISLFSDLKIKFRWLHVSIFFIFVLLCFFVNDNFVKLILGIIYEFIIFISLIDKKKKALCVFVICIILEMLIQVVTELVLHTYIINEYGIYTVVSKIITLLIIVALNIVKSLFSKDRIDSGFISYFASAILITNLTFASFPLLGLRFFKPYIDIEKFEYIILLCIIIVLVNVISYLFYCTRMKENIEYQVELASKKKMLVIQKEHTAELIQNYEDLRIFRHDINAKLGSFDYLIANKKYRELEILSKGIKKDLNPINIQCTDIYVSATLSQFINSIKEKEIDFEFNDHLTKSLEIEEVHVCTILFNLLKNAIEAVTQCDVEKNIKLILREYNHTVIIQIENSVNTDFDINNLKNNITTKDDISAHGIGLVSIKEIVKEYHGKIDFTCENNKLKISLFLLNAI
ncbi:MAG: GHKL domain-containing protein [Bacilli bacterium]